MLIKFCKNKKVAKMLAIMLIITMTFVDIAFLGKNLISYAVAENLEMQGTDTQHSNVKFDAYFSDNIGNHVHSIAFDVSSNRPKINLYIAVKKAGYLKEAYVDFRDESNGINTNYEISADTLNTTLVQNINTSSKTVSLNHISSGTETTIEIPINLAFTELMEINKIRQNSLITLRGIYVDESGKETEITKTVKLNLGWNLETEVNIEQAITKYVPYSYNQQAGVIIQLLVKVKQNRVDKALPVKSTELKIKVPEIVETLPEKVIVSANSTMATNGGKQEFTSDDWIYNEEDKTITIITKGYEENGFAWAGNGTDEYFVTYLYPSKVYESILENEIALHCEVEGKMNLYTVDGINSKTATSIGSVTLSEKVGDIVTYNIEANTKEISKGKMYANYNSDEKIHDTEYKTTIKANISDYEMIDKINITLGADNFIKEENTYTSQIGGRYYTNYKQISISKSKMQKILGEDGIINIYDNNSNIYTINNETEDIDGNYIINFETEIGELRIQTSKPVEDGILEINTLKTISKDLLYSKEQVKEFQTLEVNITGYSQYVGNTESTIQPQIAKDTITLTETSTNAKFEISNTSLSSMVKNENVEMKILLNNNVETSDLYKNAVFTIRLPKYIEDIEITGGNILYTNGLEIDYVERKYTENGIVLKVFTKGAEKDFSNGVFTNGTNIVLNTNIKVNSLAPNISDKIIFEYTNESATSYANEGKEEVAINFIAPQEMTTINSVLGSSINSAVSTDENEQIAELDILGNAKIATMELTIINKYSNVCNNIEVLGRVPFKGNKSISTGEDLGTTFDVEMLEEIKNINQIENVVIYYSNNGEATKDLNDANNNWTLNKNELSSVKSYLIVLQNYEMKPGEMIKFSYECLIPAKLEHNESAFGTYVVYFDSVSNYTKDTYTVAPTVGLTTGVGANMELATTREYNGKEIKDDQTVREGQIITYKTVINNTGTIDAENVILTSNIENGTPLDYGEAILSENTLTWNIGEIKAGESKTIEYSAKVTSANTQITNSTNVLADNFSATLEEEISNTITKAELEVSMDSRYVAGTQLINGQQIDHMISVKNLTNSTINNVVIKQTLPKGLKYVSSMLDCFEGNSDEAQSIEGAKINYDEETRKIEWNIGSLSANSELVITLITETELPSDIGFLDISTSAIATGTGIDEYSTNKYKLYLAGPILKVEQTASLQNNSYITEDNEITFTSKIRNEGGMPAYISFTQEFPLEFNVKNATFTRKDGQTGKMIVQGNNTCFASIDIEDNEEVIINITAKAELRDRVNEKAVETTTKVMENEKEIFSNKLSYTIERKTTLNPGSSGGNNNKPSVNTYRISGTAWLDSNNNGQMDPEEETLKDIGVMLINSQTGTVVQDIVNESLKKTQTNSNGMYTFTNIPSGKYIVIFEYNTNLYDLTQYNKSETSLDKNSKAISSNVNIDGKLKLVGITNTIEISNSSIANINIGLVENPKFDLSIQKGVNKITVVNKSGTKEYNFNNNNLAKVEIPGKYLYGSKVTIEYKIVVRNEGEIAGYAKKIVDYMPNNVEFDSTRNFSWYKGRDGNLYNESLSNTLINPGESKELTLILTKTMTDDNTGIINNNAEIYEAYNEQNLKDADSTPGNLAQGEDDFDTADVLISIKTGQVIIYITITLICITILAGGIYLINKKVLKGGK